MQMISKSFLKKNESWNAINNSDLFLSEEEKSTYDKVSDFGICARDYPHWPKQVLDSRINISMENSLSEKSDSDKSPKGNFQNKDGMWLPVHSSL